MAKLISTINFLIISSVLIATPNGNHAALQTPQHEADKAWFQSICQGKLENKAKLHFYLQDQFTGKNQTVFEVAHASITSTSPTCFGLIQVADDQLSVESDINSEEVGRVQGLATYADLATIAIATNFNFVFASGKYNGSTISILGRNPTTTKEERELPIVGGTGIFRFARGYAITRTIVLNADHAIFEYTLYVTYGSDSNMSLEAKHAT